MIDGEHASYVMGIPLTFTDFSKVDAICKHSGSLGRMKGCCSMALRSKLPSTCLCLPVVSAARFLSTAIHALCIMHITTKYVIHTKKYLEYLTVICRVLRIVHTMYVTYGGNYM